MKVFRRTENGATTHISIREGLAEINRAMMEGKKDVREMYAGSTGARITYKDGRRVMLLKVDAPAPMETTEQTDTASQGHRIVTVKGKRYVVGDVTPARPKTGDNCTWVPVAYVEYWSERNGKAFGATRTGSAARKPGTIGRAIWDAVSG